MVEPVDAPGATALELLATIWKATEWGGPPITTKGLAERTGTTQANVSAALRRLADQGYVTREAYRPVTLTAAGTRLAVRQVRRHRVLETWLVDELGYGWDEVHDEAERLDHAVSDLLVDRLAARLGDPATDPHGDPIPTTDGAVTPPAAATSLAAAAPGPWEVRRVDDACPHALEMLVAHGLGPGTRVEVLPARSGRVRLLVQGRRLTAGHEAEHVWGVPG